MSTYTLLKKIKKTKYIWQRYYDKCTDGGNRHHFKSVYDYGKPEKFQAEWISTDEVIKIMEASRSRTYVKDVCIWCGEERKR